MKRLLHALMAGGSLLLIGCTQGGSPSDYTGDGHLIHLEKPSLLASEGWKVLFDEFPLSQMYSATYSFAGLPEVKNLHSYTAYLHVPPATEKAQLDDATLEMSLYADEELLSEFHAPMKDWLCTSYSLGTALDGAGDGLEKSFYASSLDIPANPRTRYRLKVRYVPSEGMGGNNLGHFYLRIGGSK